jgi:hypothetical protein
MINLSYVALGWRLGLILVAQDQLVSLHGVQQACKALFAQFTR